MTTFLAYHIFSGCSSRIEPSEGIAQRAEAIEKEVKHVLGKFAAESRREELRERLESMEKRISVVEQRSSDYSTSLQTPIKSAFDAAGLEFPGLAFGLNRATDCTKVDGGQRPDLALSSRTDVLKAVLDCSSHIKVGIEMGALHQAAPVPPTCRRRFVDKFPLDHLKSIYPNLNTASLNAPDIVADAQTLDSIKDGVYDFVIGNHILEHMADPLRAIRNWLRVLRPGGLLFCAIPNKCLTFDRLRVVTSLEHMKEEMDNIDLITRNEKEHEREWALSHVTSVHNGDMQKCVSEFSSVVGIMNGVFQHGGAHYHSWDPPSFDRFVKFVSQEFGAEEKVRSYSGIEMIVVLEKKA